MTEKLMKTKYILIVSVILAGVTLSSCGVKARIKKADKKYEIGEYYEAGNIYQSVYRQVKPKDKQTRAYVAFRQGECYRHINNTKAATAYRNAIRNRYQDSIVYLRQAQVLHYQGKYADAAKGYEIYLQSHPDDYVAQGGLFACRQINEWKKQSSRYKVAAEKDFNQRRTSNFSPRYIGDEADAVMFTSNRSASSKKNARNSSITGVPVFALYSTRKNALGEWEDIEPVALAEAESSSGGGSEGGEGEGDEILDDDYLLQLHKYLQEMKKQRKQAEQDANLLDGRLRCLRDEEQKTLKKIEVTRKKTEQKMSVLQAQEEELRRRMEFRDRKQKELERLREQTKKQKENNRMAIMMKAEERRRQMEEDIRNLREQKKNNEELRKYIEVEELSNKKTQADYIKSQQIIAEEKRRAIELEKKNRIKEELERKIAEEEERIQMAEGKKQKLEQEEIEIMKKLKTTTQMHEQMVENYEKLGK